MKKKWMHECDAKFTTVRLRMAQSLLALSSRAKLGSSMLLKDPPFDECCDFFSRAWFLFGSLVDESQVFALQKEKVYNNGGTSNWINRH